MHGGVARNYVKYGNNDYILTKYVCKIHRLLVRVVRVSLLIAE